MKSNRPKFGQNFLVDPGWQKKIVAAFEPPAQFAEIGPGRGALTQHLEKKFSGFYAFEIDRELVPLHEHKAAYQIFEKDFLKWDFKIDGKDVENFSLISNLPYESGTAILLNILSHSHQIIHFVFMLQREVVERILAEPRSRTYGALSVLAQGQFDMSSLGLVKPGSFNPAPKVDSAVIRGFRRPIPHPRNELYRSFVFMAFQFKRKTLINCLKTGFSRDRIDAAFQELGWSENIRAEEVALEDWPRLFRMFHHG